MTTDSKSKVPALVTISGGGGAVVGAILVFLLQSQTEGMRQDGDIMSAVSELSEQMTIVVAQQQKILSRFDDHTRRLDNIERDQREMSLRIEGLERKQIDVETGQIKLRLELEKVSNNKSFTPDVPYDRIAEVMREILVLQESGAAGVWINRGPPYASTTVLSRRLARRVDVDERDQAAALLLAAQRFRDREHSVKEKP